MIDFRIRGPFVLFTIALDPFPFLHPIVKLPHNCMAPAINGNSKTAELFIKTQKLRIRMYKKKKMAGVGEVVHYGGFHLLETE